MSNKGNQTETVTEASELMLAREIRNLDAEIQPTRDLWSAIERNIADFEQPKKFKLTSHWMPYGVAASLLIAVSALLINLVSINQGDSPQLANNTGSLAIDNIQLEYLKVRNPLLDNFKETNSMLAPETLETLYDNIELIEMARRDIEAQIRENPQNKKLIELLIRVHRQEIDLLKQDYSKPGRFM